MASSSSKGAYVATSGGNSGLSVNLHPLPLLNIADVYNRATLTTSSSTKLVGALLGTEANRELSIVNSFELIFASQDGDSEMADEAAGSSSALPKTDGRQTWNAEFFATRQDQFKQVFPTLSVVGWYTVGEQPSLDDVILHKQFTEMIGLDTPIFLIFSPQSTPGSQSLPIKVYEAALGEGGKDEEREGQFVELEYGVETGEAERIAVEGVSRGGMGGDGEESSTVASLTTQRNAIRMLYERIQVLLEYVTSVIQKSAKPDHTILRQISALVATLPAMDAKEFQDELDTEYNDVQLTAYLTVLTKQLNALNDYADRHNLLHPPPSDDFGASHGSLRGGSRGFGFDMGAFGGSRRRK